MLHLPCILMHFIAPVTLRRDSPAWRWLADPFGHSMQAAVLGWVYDATHHVWFNPFLGFDMPVASLVSSPLNYSGMPWWRWKVQGGCRSNDILGSQAAFPGTYLSKGASRKRQFGLITANHHVTLIAHDCSASFVKTEKLFSSELAKINLSNDLS